jgi:hypothetical protein
MSNLLTKCNADVFKAIIDFNAEHPEVGQATINLLQKHEYWWQMNGSELLSFAMPMRDIWNGKVYTLYLLFESQLTTKMP